MITRRQGRLFTRRANTVKLHRKKTGNTNHLALRSAIKRCCVPSSLLPSTMDATSGSNVTNFETALLPRTGRNRKMFGRSDADHEQLLQTAATEDRRRDARGNLRADGVVDQEPNNI